MINLGAVAGLASNQRDQAVAQTYHGYVQSYLNQGKTLQEAQRLALQAFPQAAKKNPVDVAINWFIGLVIGGFVLLMIIGAIITPHMH